MSKDAVIIKTKYAAPVAKLWTAITDIGQMKEWYFDLSAFKPETGFEFSFPGTGKEGETYIHLCRITEVVHEKKLGYTWRYEGFEGMSSVSFELSPEDGDSLMILTHTGLQTFPASNPAFAQESFEEGWTYLMGTALKNFVEKK